RPIPASLHGSRRSTSRTTRARTRALPVTSRTIPGSNDKTGHMDSSRRSFVFVGTKLLLMTAATASALPHVLAGRPDASDTYQDADHWWALLIDVEKCIGCGCCVRACKAENDVINEPYYFRTWVERYHIEEGDADHPSVDSPNGGYDGFPQNRPDG